LKKHVENEKEAGKYHEKIEITDNSTGNSYRKVLGRFLDEYVTSIEIEDPYIRNIHQVKLFIFMYAFLNEYNLNFFPPKVYNLLRLCELSVGSCRNLKKIFLMTGKEPGKQQEMLDELEQSLAKNGIVLTVEYSNSLHDREIRLD